MLSALTCPRWPRVKMAAEAAVAAAACPDVLAILRVVVGSVFLLLLSTDSVWGNSTTQAPITSSNDNGTNIAAIVAPTVTLGVLAIILAVLGWLFCMVKKKRQTEGTYMPSAEEQSGAHSAAAPDALKLPKEERLI
ncbi:protein crumbs homolog 3a [Solea solea]|uniref:protein crumbs homolog 3a n=1 Tax=Solea solea TaxID=90069 RepID=UPI00272A6F11|nr:protein crumbs homolog 3a [Solea solea]XP_058510189.1 protein crumbs homolog 3a [Solea solea]XP_058510190.1 protein crumbs homolog 3a [Solea solea]